VTADPVINPARRLVMTGRVQGVGFRPFVYRLAREHGLTGHVRNLRGDVEILVAGSADRLNAFERELVERAPPLAQPVVRESSSATAPVESGFHIAPSSVADEPQVSVPPDFFTCADCLQELADPADRRYRYPFINCTQCGPRYTLIAALPYDRANTSMARFPLCTECGREYADPLDRRFHAEPVACPVCGPHLELHEPGSEPIRGSDDAALQGAIDVLRGGRVLAVRGIGGYHLLCDARSAAAVARLRERKIRPHKPLAVMFPWAGPDGLEALRQRLQVGDAPRGLRSDGGRGARPRRGRRLSPLQSAAPAAARRAGWSGRGHFGQRQR